MLVDFPVINSQEGPLQKNIKDRITPHVNNFSRLRRSTEKQPGKRKYESDGGVMVGEFACVGMYVHVQVCHFGRRVRVRVSV